MQEGWSTSGLDLHLELSSSGGRRAALERSLREAIRAGRLVAGTRLPPTRALSMELGMSRGTVSTAYDQLVAEGYLLARVGSGTVVADMSHLRVGTPTLPSTGDPPRYDLRPGQPDVTKFPVAAWLRSARRAITNARASVFDYGEPAGRIELRAALSEYLGRTRGVLATPEQIVITTGYVQALALLTRVVDDEAAIAMENPGLPFHGDVVRRAGGRVVALGVDEMGARTDRLAMMDVTAAVLTPAHQYPLGMALHPQRRHAAIEWARSRGGLVVEDDYDGEFRYDRQPVGAMQGIAPDQVVYVGTASKTLGPALRLAWVVLPARLVEPFVDAKRHADLHSDTFSQLTLADLIATHAYDRHVRSSRLMYRRRRDLLVGRLAPLRHVTVEGVAAGLHAVVRTAEPRHVDAVLDEAPRHGLALDELGPHWLGAGDRTRGIIVGYSTPSAGTYPAALDVLVRVLRTVDGMRSTSSALTCRSRVPFRR
jgi:GntR family transcriptional regulator/MocR family aminotransferase